LGFAIATLLAHNFADAPHQVGLFYDPMLLFQFFEHLDGRHVQGLSPDEG
jgi:hypothetical protein